MYIFELTYLDLIAGSNPDDSPKRTPSQDPQVSSLIIFESQIQIFLNLTTSYK